MPTEHPAFLVLCPGAPLSPRREGQTLPSHWGHCPTALQFGDKHRGGDTRAMGVLSPSVAFSAPAGHPWLHRLDVPKVGTDLHPRASEEPRAPALLGTAPAPLS